MKLTIIPNHPKFENLIRLYPPVLANKILPDWYKSKKFSTQHEHWKNSMGYDNSEVITAKNCPAVQDLISTGVVLPIWSKFSFVTERDNEGNITKQNWRFQAANAYGDNLQEHLSYHTEEQVKDLNIKTTVDGKLLKIFCPYKFIAPEGYNILFTDPYYHFRQDIRCLPGIIEADKWGFVTIPFEILKDEFEINAGEPLVHLYLIKREDTKLILDVREGTNEEYKQALDDLIFLTSSSQNYRNKKKDIYEK